MAPQAATSCAMCVSSFARLAGTVSRRQQFHADDSCTLPTVAAGANTGCGRPSLFGGSWRSGQTADVPQTERPDEIEAKAIIEAELAVSLRHADTKGGVDYLFELPDGTTAAAEITTVTNESLKRSNDAWMRLRRRQQPTSELSRCWTVIVHEDRATYNGLLEALVPALAALESASIDCFREIAVGTSEATEQALGTAGPPAVKVPAPYVRPWAATSPRGSRSSSRRWRWTSTRRPCAYRTLPASLSSPRRSG